MRRSILLMLSGTALILAMLYALKFAQRATTAAPTKLLPNDTVAFVHVPDFNGIIDSWHQSDIYKIYEEPAVREFLRVSDRTPSRGPFFDTLNQIRELQAKDAFVAMTSIANNEPKLVAGFRFRSKEEVATGVLNQWKGNI